MRKANNTLTIVTGVYASVAESALVPEGVVHQKSVKLMVRCTGLANSFLALMDAIGVDVGEMAPCDVHE